MLVFLSFLFIFSTLRFVFKLTKPSVDHYTHIAFVKWIKENNNKFISTYSSVIDVKNFMYPQLMHFILSFLPIKFVQEKYLRINFIVEIILYGFATFMVVYFLGDFSLPTIGIASLLIVTNPFNRFLWNAKVSGISARNFGILTNLLYLFYFASSIFSHNIYIRIGGFVLLGFIIILSSQFATQFLILFCIINVFFGNYLSAVALPLSFLLYYITMPKLFLSYMRGQYQHKKIWIKHLTKIDLLNSRPSIYRDFIFDFFKKRNLKYFLTNPIIEVIIGFPLLIVLAILSPLSVLDNTVIITTLICFVLTSTKFTRFLGEPQRYVELALPFLVFIAIKYLSTEILYAVIIFNIISFVFHINIFANFFGVDKFSLDNRLKLKDKIIENKGTTKPLIMGNNWGMPAYFLAEKDISIMMPTFTNWNQYNVGIDKMFPKSLFSLDHNIAIELIKNYRPGWFILDEYYWKVGDFEISLAEAGILLEQQKDCEPVVFYKIGYNNLA